MKKIRALKSFVGFQKGQEFVIDPGQRAFFEIVEKAIADGNAKDVTDEVPKKAVTKKKTTKTK